MKEVYADHAATTFPRPPEVVSAVSSYLAEIGCNPGRGGYKRSLEAARLVYEARHNMAILLGVSSPENIIFTPSVTYSLNLVLKGILGLGDHVITTSMEHNAVMRPLYRLAREKGVIVEQLPCRQDGTLDSLLLKKALRPETKLVVVTHASNVTGTLLPVCEIGDILAGRDIFYAIDAAQTAGVVPFDFPELKCDYLAFTGHKGLLGIPGIGGLAMSERALSCTDSLVEGGTGSASEKEEQPEFHPDKFESGTLNVPGIAGLNAGVKLIEKFGIDKIWAEKQELTGLFLAKLVEMPEVNIYGPQKPEKMTATVSLSVTGLDSGNLSYILDHVYGVMTRSGLHCSPSAHRTIGTFPEGTLRFSFGYANTKSDIDYITTALTEIVKENR